MRTHLMRDAAIKAHALRFYFEEAFEQMGTIKSSDEAAEILKQLIAENKAKALLTKAERKEKRQKELLDELQKLNPNATLDANGNVQLGNTSDTSDKRKQTTITISKLIDEFITERDRLGGWRAKTREETLAKLQLFKRITGDLPISHLNDVKVREYRQTIQKLPANLNKIQRYRGKTITEIVCMEGVEPMELRTLGKNLEKVKSLLRWGYEQRYLSEDLTPLLKFKISAEYDDQRHPFTASDIELLFLNDEILGRSPKYSNKSYQFWVPLLALFTGARINELCQLYTDDVKRQGKHWCISINDEKEKTLKNKSSRRIIPLSKTLIDIGFLKFAEQRKKENSERLFPELSKSRDGYSSVASKWFALYKKRCGVDHPKKVFHSFRNTVVSHLQEKGFPEPKIGAFVGHSTDSITFKVYGGAYSPEALSEIANAIDYGVDLSPLKKAAIKFHPAFK